MPRNVHVSGTSDGLKEAIEERLQRAGASMVDKADEADITIRFDEDEPCDIAVVPFGSKASKSGMMIELSDVIIPNGGRKWGNGTMIDWVQQIKRGEDPPIESETRFWVNVRDVADAISTLCLGNKDKPVEGSFRMCGRRSWKSEHVIDEIRVLWNRYNNAINHTHTAESLSEVPSPVRGIFSNGVKKPDLRGLHEALIASGGEGWHPLVPMRISLMEMIAHSD